jgi:hypothetical protein
MDVGSFMSFLPDPAAPVPGVGGANQVQAPIDMIGPPTTDRHKALLDHLNGLIKMSQAEMNKFYTRWRFSERQYQAFMYSKDLESLRKASNERGNAPEQVTIVVPYSYATIQTIVTYLLQTFCGRKPMYQVGSYRSDTVDRAKNLETVLQYNVDHARLIRKYIQFFLDGEIYGLSSCETYGRSRVEPGPSGNRPMWLASWGIWARPCSRPVKTGSSSRVMKSGTSIPSGSSQIRVCRWRK